MRQFKSMLKGLELRFCVNYIYSRTSYVVPMERAWTVYFNYAKKVQMCFWNYKRGSRTSCNMHLIHSYNHLCNTSNLKRRLQLCTLLKIPKIALLGFRRYVIKRYVMILIVNTPLSTLVEIVNTPLSTLVEIVNTPLSTLVKIVNTPLSTLVET